MGEGRSRGTGSTPTVRRRTGRRAPVSRRPGATEAGTGAAYVTGALRGATIAETSAWRPSAADQGNT
jgi:hypothetical protein